MDWKGMLSAVSKPDKNAATYELSTDFKYTGLQEYPRPQLQRKSYINLNGTWDYRITDSKGACVCEGPIEVPFSPEAKLSGTVGHVLKSDETLEYSKVFVLEKVKKSKHLILHFGAVDQVCQVSINGINLGTHEGGYTSFSFDISDFILEGDNEIKVKVWDYLDAIGHARGKQSYEPSGMWYSAQSGIWQTVWMEWVPEAYVTSLKIRPDIDDDSLEMELKISELKGDVTISSSNQDLIKII